MKAEFVHFLVLISLCGLQPAGSAQQLAPPEREIALYTGVAPGSEKWDWSERLVTSGNGAPIAQNVVVPWCSIMAESGFGSALAILKKPRLHGALAAVAFTIVLS